MRWRFIAREDRLVKRASLDILLDRVFDIVSIWHWPSDLQAAGYFVLSRGRNLSDWRPMTRGRGYVRPGL